PSTSVYTYDADGYLTNVFTEASTSQDYTNNSDGTVQSLIFQFWNGSSYENFYKYIYTYNSNSDISTLEVCAWDGSAWGSPSTSVYTYDANGYLTNVFTEASTSWDYTNNSDGTVQSWIYQAWNGSSYENFYKYIYTYVESASSIDQIVENEKVVIRIVDTMGRITSHKKNNVLIYIYSDGTTKKVFETE
ncbi:MAG: hypothetical protein ACKVJH_02580, partial [Flavobacteriales bacterium]